MPVRTRAAIVAVLATAAAVLAPASSLAAWTNPFPVSGPGGLDDPQDVAIDATAKAFVVWNRGSDGLTFVATRAPDGTLSSAAQVSAVISQEPAVAANAAGLAAIVFAHPVGGEQRIAIRMRTAAGQLLATSTVSPAGAGASQPDVGVDDAGNAIVSWEEDGEPTRTMMRVRRANGTFGPVTVVSTGSFSERPQLAVEPGGRAFFTWIEHLSGGDQLVRGRARDAAGALSAPVTLSGTAGTIRPTADPTSVTSLAIDNAGKALIAWRKSLGGESRVQARTRAADGTLSPITTLSAAGHDATLPQAAISRTGDVGAVVWIRPDGTNYRTQLRRIAGGAWQPVEDVSPAGIDTFDTPRVGLSGDGSRAIVAFGTAEGVQRVRARTRFPDGTYGPADVLSASNGFVAERPQMAVNGAGQAVAAWRQSDGANVLLWTGANFIP